MTLFKPKLNQRMKTSSLAQAIGTQMLSELHQRVIAHLLFKDTSESHLQMTTLFKSEMMESKSRVQALGLQMMLPQRASFSLN